MKIYISGKLTGSEKDIFSNAQSLLSEIGFDVVNPCDFTPLKKSLNDRISARVGHLLDCDGIFLMDSWVESTESQIERDVATRMGKFILHERNINEKCSEVDRVRAIEQERITGIVLNIQNAIYEVTGMKFKDYVTKSRQRDGFYARMIFVYHCRKARMKLTKIAEYVHRDHSSMLHLLNKYQDEMKYNPSFRYMATKVNNILNDNNETQV